MEELRPVINVSSETLYNHLPCVNPSEWMITVDLRSKSEFDLDHIEEAVSFPLDEVKEMSKEVLEKRVVELLDGKSRGTRKFTSESTKIRS